MKQDAFQKCVLFTLLVIMLMLGLILGNLWSG